MSENLIFLNIELDLDMKHMLNKTYRLVVNLIKNRPSLHYRIIKYSSKSSWDRQSYHLDTNANCIKYFESFSSQPQVSLPLMRKNFLNKIEYNKLKLQIISTNILDKQNVMSFRRLA